MGLLARWLKNGAVTQQKISKSAQAALRGLKGPQGDPGLEGPKGDKGDPGAPAVKFWAVFSADGTVVRSSGLMGQDVKGTGVHHPFWNAGVSGCSYSATLRSVADPGATITADLGSFPDTVDVQTFDAAAVGHDGPFNVQVFC